MDDGERHFQIANFPPFSLRTLRALLNNVVSVKRTRRPFQFEHDSQIILCVLCALCG
jgi:hypothetical protein